MVTELLAILAIVMCEATLCVMVAVHAEIYDTGEGND
jgi:hypothetical protein